MCDKCYAHDHKVAESLPFIEIGQEHSVGSSYSFDRELTVGIC
jgi:hypothetical protein